MDDYVYLGEAQGDDAQRQCPILVLKNGRDRWWSSPVYCAKKGTERFGVRSDWQQS